MGKLVGLPTTIDQVVRRSLAKGYRLSGIGMYNSYSELSKSGPSVEVHFYQLSTYLSCLHDLLNPPPLTPSLSFSCWQKTKNKKRRVPLVDEKEPN